MGFAASPGPIQNTGQGARERPVMTGHSKANERRTLAFRSPLLSALKRLKNQGLP